MGMSVLQMAKTAFKLKHIYMLHVAKKHIIVNHVLPGMLLIGIIRHLLLQDIVVILIHIYTFLFFTHINMFDSTKLSNQCQIYVVYLCYNY